jgi:hypothetical protein
MSRLCLLTILAAIVLAALVFTPMLRAQTSTADTTLLDAANHDRAAAGLQPLKWDNALADAAHQHALRMARANTLSHQLPGEPTMQDRAHQAGARFSMIAENVAQGPSVSGLHTQWMNSPPHRENLLDPHLNAVGISVVQSGNIYFAVEDFSVAVLSLSLEEQEQQILSQLSQLGLHATATADARKTCVSDRAVPAQKPVTVVHYETADLSNLPDEVVQKVDNGKYHSASVGACEPSGSGTFTRYRIAIHLF